MSGLFDARDSGAAALRNVAPGPPATLGDSVESAFGSVVANDLSVSEDMLLNDEYELYLEEVEGQAGKRVVSFP